MHVRFNVGMSSLSLGLLLAALIMAAQGCSGGEKTVRVFGDISYGDEPVKDGTIVFVPMDGTRGRQTGGKIADGRYELPAKDGPLAGGTYRVEIQGQRPSGHRYVINPNDPPIEQMDVYIPAAYNQTSTLKTSFPSDATNERRDFSLDVVPTMKR